MVQHRESMALYCKSEPQDSQLGPKHSNLGVQNSKTGPQDSNSGSRNNTSQPEIICDWCRGHGLLDQGPASQNFLNSQAQL